MLGRTGVQTLNTDVLTAPVMAQSSLNQQPAERAYATFAAGHPQINLPTQDIMNALNSSIYNIPVWIIILVIIAIFLIWKL